MFESLIFIEVVPKNPPRGFKVVEVIMPFVKSVSDSAVTRVKFWVILLTILLIRVILAKLVHQGRSWLQIVVVRSPSQHPLIEGVLIDEFVHELGP